MCSLVEYRCRPELVHKLEENNLFLFLFYLNILHQTEKCVKERKAWVWKLTCMVLNCFMLNPMCCVISADRKKLWEQSNVC